MSKPLEESLEPIQVRAKAAIIILYVCLGASWAFFFLAFAVDYFDENNWRGLRDYHQTTMETNQIDLIASDSCSDGSGGTWITGKKEIDATDKSSKRQFRIALCQIDSDNSVSWVQEPNTIGLSEGLSVSIFSSGNPIVVGIDYIACFSKSGKLLWRDTVKSGICSRCVVSGEGALVAGIFSGKVSFENSCSELYAENNAVFLAVYNEQGKIVELVKGPSSKQIVLRKVIGDGNNGFWIACEFEGILEWEGKSNEVARKSSFLAHFNSAMKCDALKIFSTRMLLSVCEDGKGGGWIASQAPTPEIDGVEFKGAGSSEVFIAHFDSTGTFDKGKGIFGRFNGAEILLSSEGDLWFTGTARDRVSAGDIYYTDYSPGTKVVTYRFDPYSVEPTGKSVFTYDGPMLSFRITEVRNGDIRITSKFWGDMDFTSGSESCKKGEFRTVIVKIKKLEEK